MRKADADQTRPTPTWIERQAAVLRSAAAAHLARQWSDRKARSDHSLLFADYLPLADREADIAFNEAITERALAHVLEDDDPYLVAFLGSKIVERTFRDHYQISNPKAPMRNLAVAKRFGIFFTPPEVALEMAGGIQASAVVLDPCCGAGALLASVMIRSPRAKMPLRGIELDPFIAECARKILTRVRDLTGYVGQLEVKCGDGLKALLARSSAGSQPVHILVNPPYGRLRLTKDSFTNAETALSNREAAHKELEARLATDVRALRAAFPEERGLLEISRLFFRLCCGETSRGGSACIISPDAWMSSRDAKSLRLLLVSDRMLESVQLIPEDQGGFATVNQALAITRLSNAERTAFSLKDDRTVFQIKFDEAALADGGPIRKIASDAAALLTRLDSGLKIKHVAWIKNARGELDQTLARDLFVEARTNIPLIRGDHIERFGVSHRSSAKHPSYVHEKSLLSTLGGKPKLEDFRRSRIVGRQCSYAKQKRRLIFARIPARAAVGNSCNYLVVDGANENEVQARQAFVLGILNSAVADWYFRASNSNNHVGNYEIDELPLPGDTTFSELIALCAESLETCDSENSRLWVHLLEAAVAAAFRLSETELEHVLQAVGDCDVARATNYLRHLTRVDLRLPKRTEQGYFNNESPTLSALDRLIISHVPEGGNWQSIPASVPSERLKQIRAMTAERGVVRTTYYGRLRRDQPAYTINTYFNRPGNGTHIHPVHDRTLTSREAARLQSFPDSFIFCGPEGAVRNQIGNAVPPLLARAVGERFLPYASSFTCIDMFCGAGGLSFGLEHAGWNIVAAVDNDKHALDTYCVNHRSVLGMPDEKQRGLTAVLQRDLSDRSSFEELVRDLQIVLAGRSLDLLAGGPPCQGFSHAGFRQMTDSRNDLASMYLHFAERLRPRIFLLENVEGLATMGGGKVLRDLCETLEELGYRVANPVWKLNAEQYGVPQMRRRVFLVATLDPAIELSPPAATHAKCEGRRAPLISSESNLPLPFSVQTALAGLNWSADNQVSALSEWLAK